MGRQIHNQKTLPSLESSSPSLIQRSMSSSAVLDNKPALTPHYPDNSTQSSRQISQPASGAAFSHDFSRIPIFPIERQAAPPIPETLNNKGQPLPALLYSWLPEVTRSVPTPVAQTPVYYPSAMADRLHVKALTVLDGIHLGTQMSNLPKSQRNAILAHESVHRVQQMRGEHRGEQPDIELEAHALAVDLLAGRSVQPRFRVDSRTPLADTPHDQMVVERAKRRLALLKAYVEEWETREARRLKSQIERDPLLEKRQAMDISSADPGEQLIPGQRAKIEAENLAKLNRLPLDIDISEDAVRFRVKFHVRFEDPASATRFGELRGSLEEGIRIVWNQRLKGAVFGGRRFTIEPEFTLVPAKAARNRNFWLITVRATNTGPIVYPGCSFPEPPKDIPTSATDALCDGGVMSIPPAHISKPDVLGHEMLHLFGLIDRYINLERRLPGKKPTVQHIPTRETGGRPDPLGAQKGPILAEDLAFLFDRLGIYTMEQNRALNTLRQLEQVGISIEAVIAEIHRQEEIIRLGRDPRSLIPIREDFRKEMERDIP